MVDPFRRRALRLIQENLLHFRRQKLLYWNDVSAARNLLLKHKLHVDITNFLFEILKLDLFEFFGRTYIMINFIDGWRSMSVAIPKSVTKSGQIMIRVPSGIWVVEIEKLGIQPKYVVHILLS